MQNRLINQIYEAGIDDSAWSNVMLGVSDLLGGSAVTLAGRLATEAEVTILGGERIDPGAFAMVAKDYTSVETNPRLRYQHFMPVGTPISRSHLVDDENFRRSWFYNDILRRADLFHELIVSLRCDDVSASAMSILRPERMNAYDERELTVLLGVVPHLQAALEIRTRLKGAIARRSGMMALLDRMPWGVFLLSASGRVLEMSRKARQLVDDGQELVLNCEGLHPMNSSHARKFHQLVRNAAIEGTGGAMSLPRCGPGRPLSLFAAPLSGPQGELCVVRAAVALFVTDPDFLSGPLPAALDRLYGLTMAETALAIEIASGVGLDAVAEKLGISRNTAKTHLSRIFNKTGASRQAELVRLLGSSSFPPTATDS